MEVSVTENVYTNLESSCMAVCLYFEDLIHVTMATNTVWYTLLIA